MKAGWKQDKRSETVAMMMILFVDGVSYWTLNTIMYTFGPPYKIQTCFGHFFIILGALMKFSMIVLTSNGRGCFVLWRQQDASRSGSLSIGSRVSCLHRQCPVPSSVNRLPAHIALLEHSLIKSKTITWCAAESIDGEGCGTGRLCHRGCNQRWRAGSQSETGCQINHKELLSF